MSYRILIQRNEDNQRRWREMDLPWDQNTLFWLTEGNFGCDCNRQWEFERACGETITEDPDPECGHSRFSIIRAELDDGSILNVDNYQNGGLDWPTS